MAARARAAGLERGRILILIAGVPYTCPPGPYECAMLLDDHLRERGIRDDVEIAVATVQPMLLPNAGRVVLEDGDLPFDVLVGVPPHRVSDVVGTSALAGKGGWIAVDPATLGTGYAGVWAIGDVTRIELANGLPFPKAGVTAEAAGLRVAAAIAAEVLGG